MYKPLIHSKSITELHKNMGLDAPSNPLNFNHRHQDVDLWEGCRW